MNRILTHILSCLTLIVVPALYVKIARRTKSPEYLARLIERLSAGQDTSHGTGGAAEGAPAAAGSTPPHTAPAG